MQTCKRGHPWEGPDADVYYRKDGARVCNACRRAKHPTSLRDRRLKRRIAALEAELDRLQKTLEAPPSTPELILDVLEANRCEWFTLAALELEVAAPAATIRQAVQRLKKTDQILWRKPRGGATSPSEVRHRPQ